MKVWDDGAIRTGSAQKIIAEIRQANNSDAFISQLTADQYTDKLNEFCRSLVSSALRQEIEKTPDKYLKALIYLSFTSPRVKIFEM